MPPAPRCMTVALTRVAIIMLSATGDAVHVLPVVTALKRRHPGCHISWVLQPTPASLVRGHPCLDEIIPFDRRRGVRAFLDARRALTRHPFDVVLDLQTYLKAGLLTGLASARIKLGFDRARTRDVNWLFTTHRVPPHPTQHVQDEFFEFLEYLGVPHDPVEWHLGPWPDERAWRRQFASTFERPIAVLVIGSSRRDKDWLPERWAALCDILSREYDLQPVLVGARTRREVATEHVIVQRTQTRPHSALDCGLRRLVSIIDAAALVISLDTGPLHMAVALGRPVISLIGYTDPRRTGPYRRFQDLIIDTFHDPGEVGPITRRTRPGRMPRISVRDVADKVALWSARYRTRPDAVPERG